MAHNLQLLHWSPPPERSQAAPTLSALSRPPLPPFSIHCGQWVSQNRPTRYMMVQPDTRATTSSQRFASRAAAAVLLIGSFVLVGQMLSIHASRRVMAELGPVRTTTLLVLLSGLAL